MSDTPVVTRFAPSPTGFLHIGGARTALFNWLFARNQGGTFLLRIEDTDRERSTPEATAAIYDGLKWLGLDWDGDAISQFERRERHAEVAKAMLDNGTAYRCYATQDEIEAFRESARAEGKSTLYQSPWRDAEPSTAPDLPFVVRLKAPREGEVRIKDKVQKDVKWQADTLDDMVLLRSDGTPTYMLAVVVDDHDMGVTHIIRGDDHLINAGRQSLIYRAMGWDIPVFAHIPLIHGDDGKKLSKRHGALGAEAYREMGYTPATMRNYLTRLGWSHGNDELFTTEQAVEWFDFKGLGKSPARLDLKKLDHVGGYQIGIAPDDVLLADLQTYLAATNQPALTDADRVKLIAVLPLLKDRSKKLSDVLEKAHFILGSRPFTPDASAQSLLDSVSLGILKELTAALQHVTWSHDGLETCLKEFAQANDLKLGKIAQPLRAALTGRTVSPSVFDMMVALGKEESLGRLQDAITPT
ncbi:glutamate--tRNA ligase [Roseobacter sp. N2S]|uniref:glutamate--tRNA ligase n=1 Tax=Roseobacter sp. N2S TaxID=2663844 RepID=UPI00285B85B0|nr:glutamate--tRNA ligase [Roseobacter sp. N2S]MDR6265496.1 glutamyl-tRNA synthetase [Roseobacter sp. N2S]